MLKVIKKQTRTGIDIPFFFESTALTEEYKNYINEKYSKTGKLLSVSRHMSEDELESYLVTEWRSESDFLEFVTDAVCTDQQHAPNVEYDMKHNIISDVTINEQ